MCIRICLLQFCIIARVYEKTWDFKPCQQVWMISAHRHACALTLMIFPCTHENWVQHPMGMRSHNWAFPRTRTLVWMRQNNVNGLPLLYLSHNSHSTSRSATQLHTHPSSSTKSRPTAIIPEPVSQPPPSTETKIIGYICHVRVLSCCLLGVRNESGQTQSWTTSRIFIEGLMYLIMVTKQKIIACKIRFDNNKNKTNIK